MTDDSDELRRRAADMTALLVLTKDELVQLTGYRQRRRQKDWIKQHLQIAAPVRADGTPVLTRLQVETALSAKPGSISAGPNWSKVSA